MKSILDKSFVYRDSANTNLKMTFDRERKRLRELAKARGEDLKPTNVVRIEPGLRVR